MSEIDFRKGDKVRIRKGAPVRTFGKGGDRIQGRTMVVTVNHVRRWGGHRNYENEVVWAGRGGYWTSTTFDHAELVTRG